MTCVCGVLEQLMECLCCESVYVSIDCLCCLIVVPVPADAVIRQHWFA